MRLVGENQAIGAETLSIQELARGRMAKSVLDAAWSEFFRQLGYKSDWYGRDFVQHNRFFPSTKTCNDCNFVVASMPLHVQTFVCPSCGSIKDRDTNAVLNLEPVAICPTATSDSAESPNACGDSVRRNGHDQRAIVDEARIPYL